MPLRTNLGFNASRSFITVFTSFHYWTISWATCITFTFSHAVYLISVLISSSFRSPCLPSRCSNQVLHDFSYMLCVWLPRPKLRPSFRYLISVWWDVPLVMQLLLNPFNFLPPTSKYPPQHVVIKEASIHVFSYGDRHRFTAR